jgi:hypothetical protein
MTVLLKTSPHSSAAGKWTQPTPLRGNHQLRPASLVLLTGQKRHPHGLGNRQLTRIGG